jgi:hypothetical protein
MAATATPHVQNETQNESQNGSQTDPGELWPGKTWQIPKPIAIEEYRNTTYHPDCDFVDGYVVPRRPPEGNYTEQEIKELFVGEWEHNKLQKLLMLWFGTHESQWGVDSVPEQRISVSATRDRVCDFCVLRADAPRESVILTPPLLCIEILSPTDRLSRARIVLRDYHLMGVPHIWLIDPIQRKAWAYNATGLHEVPATRLQVPNSPIHVPIAELLDKIS